MPDPPRSKSSEQFAVGTQLNGRYEICGVLGKGGTATVYDAFDHVIHREVAVKVVKPVVNSRHPEEDDKNVARFQREARASARIVHPNVVTIHDMGVLTGTTQPFIVMEKLAGRNLEEELRDVGRMKPARALRLFSKALDAIALGHEEGIVHRDLKPANLFLVSPGRPAEDVRVLDFGIAWDNWGKRLSATGQLFGTARYLAPEYLVHQKVTPALDVYQLGLVLVEMLTGTPVMGMDRKPGECIYAHVNGELDVPTRLLDSPLGPVLLAALARDHATRLSNARVFLDVISKVNPNDIPIVGAHESLSRVTQDASTNALTELEVDHTGPMGKALAMQHDPYGDEPTIIGVSGLASWLDAKGDAGFGEVTISAAAARNVLSFDGEELELDDAEMMDAVFTNEELDASADAPILSNMAPPSPRMMLDDSGSDRVVSAPMMNAWSGDLTIEDDRSDKAIRAAVLSHMSPAPGPQDDDDTRVHELPPVERRRDTSDYTATVLIEPESVKGASKSRVNTRTIIVVIATVGGGALLLVAALLAVLLLFE